MTAYRDNIDGVSLQAPIGPFTSTSTSADDTTTPTPLPSKKRRTPNAFIVFRSFMIANRSYPLELKHQSDVSRYIAGLWRGMSEKERSYFFRMAEEKRAAIELGGTSPLVRQKKRTRRKSRGSRSPKVSEPGLRQYVAQGHSSEPNDLAFLSLPYTATPGSSTDLGLPPQSPASDPGSPTSSHLSTSTDSPNSSPTDVASSMSSILPAFAFSQRVSEPCGSDSPQTPQDISANPPYYPACDEHTSFSALGLEWQDLREFQFESSSSTFDSSSFSTAMSLPAPECFTTLDAFQAEPDRTGTHIAPSTDFDFDGFFGNAYIHLGLGPSL